MHVAHQVFMVASPKSKEKATSSINKQKLAPIAQTKKHDGDKIKSPKMLLCKYCKANDHAILECSKLGMKEVEKEANMVIGNAALFYKELASVVSNVE